MKVFILLWALFIPVLGFAQCNKLRKVTDKISGEIRIRTDATEPAVVTRFELGKDHSFFMLNLSAPAGTVGEGKGVTVLFKDGTKMEWPDEAVRISVAALHPRWDSQITAKASVLLDHDQILKLATQPITDYKLHVYTWSVKERFGVSLQEQTECLVKAEPSEIKNL